MRVLTQRAFFARGSRFFPSSLCRRAAKELVDCVEYFVHICKHLIVPKSKDSIVPRLQKRSANFIFMRKLCVLGAIQFDYKALLYRAEVSEKRTNRMLTPELYVLHPAASQVSPQNSFSVCLFATQPSSVPLR